MSGLHVAIAGATGAVGAEFLPPSRKRSYPIGEALAAREQAERRQDAPLPGEKMRSRNDPRRLRGRRTLLLQRGAPARARSSPPRQPQRAVVDRHVQRLPLRGRHPLVIPEINPTTPHAQGRHREPNCTTIVALMAAGPLPPPPSGWRRAVMSSYQAISGAGAQAMAELERQVHDWPPAAPLQVKQQPNRSLNVIPRIDACRTNFYTKEEMKFLWEGKKILHHPGPARHRHLRARAGVPLARRVAEPRVREAGDAADRARRAEQGAGLQVHGRPASEIYPTPLEASDRTTFSSAACARTSRCRWPRPRALGGRRPTREGRCAQRRTDSASCSCAKVTPQRA